MKHFGMARLGLAALLAVGTCAISSPRAAAQGFGGGGMPPAIQAKIKAWQKWGEQHKKLTGLGDLLGQIGEMEKDPSYQLDKKQAGSMLKIITPWRTKDSMSEDQAQDVTKKLNGVLTVRQIKKIATIEPASAKMRRGGFGGGGGRPGGGGPGGGRPAGGPGGGRPGGFTFPDPPAKGWNPFNPDTLPFVQARPMAKQRMDSFLGDLNKKAKG